MSMPPTGIGRTESVVNKKTLGDERSEPDPQDDLRRCANDLLLIERAKKWLLED